MPNFHGYSSSPAPRLFFPLKNEPGPLPEPETARPLFPCNIGALGWILSSVFSGNFIAYRAMSATLSDLDCAQASAAKSASRPADNPSKRFDLIEPIR